MSLDNHSHFFSSHSELDQLFTHLHDSYITAIQESGGELKKGEMLFQQLVKLTEKQLESPYHFSLYHQRVSQPFDYWNFGVEFFRPLVNFEDSSIQGIENVANMIKQLEKGENVILFANHQTEPDPQLIYLLLEPFYPKFAKEIIFVAGHRIRNDPLAVPLSLGCNLLCIFSKRHIDHPPEEKTKKMSHNQRTLKKMSELLDEGGKCIYVAPSGGRDRPNEKGIIKIAPFDSQSIEMFWLITQQAKRPTHFYPLALSTYSLQPPPAQIHKEIGEAREVHYKPVGLSFGKEIDMQTIVSDTQLSKKEIRQQRAILIWNLISDQYRQLLQILSKKDPSLTKQLEK